MIRAVTVTNYLGESKRFELAFPEKSGFAVQSITRLKFLRMMDRCITQQE